MSKLDPKIVDIAEELGWTVREYEDGMAEFSQYSPAGEDFSFSVNAENAAQEIYECYNDFDVDEHIEMWIMAKASGEQGVPSTRRLVVDAEDICGMLEKLACAISEEVK